MRILLILLSIFFFSCESVVKKKNESKNDSIDIKSENDNALKTNWDNIAITDLEIEGYSPQFINENQILFTSNGFNGLWIYDLESKETKLISNKKGIGYKPAINGDNIIYQVRDKVKYLEKITISNTEIERISKNQSPQVYLDEGKRSEKLINKSAELSSDLLSIIIKDRNGEVKKLSPQGEKNYLDVSFSPNEEMLAYTVAGLGGFVSDPKGGVLLALGEINSPCWVDNEHLLFYESKDDGYQILSSDIFVQNIVSGEKYHLTKSIDEILENPSALLNGNSVISNTPDGKIFLLKSGHKK